MKSLSSQFLVGLGLAIASSGLSGCEAKGSAGAGSSLAGQVVVDGSSTVYPITEAVAEEFRKVHPRVKVEIGVSGTGGGFKKFASGRTMINDASRPIKASESETAAEHRVEFLELPVAYDGLTVVVNKENHFAEFLTVAELAKIWSPSSKVDNWNQVRAGFPDLPLKLYGPGTDSGTFDYFTKAINGKEGACRPDFTASEDDFRLVAGVAGDKGSLGFFGYAYYVNNQAKLNAVKIQDESGDPVAPSLESINDGTYRPLSRPIFIYVSKAAAEQEEVRFFVQFYLDNAPSLVEEAGYVKLPEVVYAAARKRFADRTTGTIFATKDAETKTLIQLYQD